jgi:hypothetical protein
MKSTTDIADIPHFPNAIITSFGVEAVAVAMIGSRRSNANGFMS